ncbi:MAG TPA: class I SAM-dependent methyltransferase [Candidatus Acidoferrum sp.]|nr:class I SAM-dependent methyltransferase [Candidatus Acidoferrum sp.]
MSFAAGWLRLDDLRGAITRTWDNFGRSETLVLSGLMPWERALYERFLKPEDRILVIGCGSGRDLIALLRLGFRVEGLDVAPRAIALARRMLDGQGLSADLYTGSVETVAFAGAFDVFIFSWFCYGYIPQTATRIEVLRKVKAHLKPGGRIVICYNPAERPARALPIGLARFAARLTRSDWRPEPGDVVGAVAGNRQAVHYEHQFWEGELENEARAAGLAVVHHERGEVGTAVLMI